MAEVKGFDKVKLFVQTNAIVIVGALLAAVAYCIFRMKKRNVKLFGR
jgi:hypothetical protein